MTVLNDVKVKLEYAKSRKEAGEQGYDPAIEFYQKIVNEMQSDKEYIKQLTEMIGSETISEHFGSS